jgi:hypothetical protein
MSILSTRIRHPRERGQCVGLEGTAAVFHQGDRGHERQVVHNGGAEKLGRQREELHLGGELGEPVEIRRRPEFGAVVDAERAATDGRQGRPHRVEWGQVRR